MNKEDQKEEQMYFAALKQTITIFSKEIFGKKCLEDLIINCFKRMLANGVSLLSVLCY
jgi:hypothetical protein